jgi:hypothetical protein
MVSAHGDLNAFLTALHNLNILGQRNNMGWESQVEDGTSQRWRMELVILLLSVILLVLLGITVLTER